MSGQVVQILTDNQFKQLGLSALGDILMLRKFCEPGTQPDDKKMYGGESVTSVTHQDKRKKRTRMLKLMLQGENKGPSAVSTDDTGHRPEKKRAAGRPRAPFKQVLVGLRVDIPDKKGKPYTRVDSPLGDDHTISIHFDVQDPYDAMLELMKNKLFPGGTNPVIGSVSHYRAEIVNSSNHNIETDIPIVCTLANYLEHKMLFGTIRLYLFCSRLSTASVECGDGTGSDETEADIDDLMPTANKNPSTFIKRRSCNNKISTTDISVPHHIMSTPVIERPVPHLEMSTAVIERPVPHLEMSTAVIERPVPHFEMSTAIVDRPVPNHGMSTAVTNGPDTHIAIDVRPTSSHGIFDIVNTLPAFPQNIPQVSNTVFYTTNSPEYERAPTEIVVSRPSTNYVDVTSSGEVAFRTSTPISCDILENNITDELLQGTFSGLLPNEFPDPTLRSILTHLELQIEEDGNSNIVNVVRQSVLDGGFRAFGRSSFLPQRRLDVRFMGEDGFDSGGLRREFATLAVSAIRDLPIFGGPLSARLLQLDYSGSIFYCTVPHSDTCGAATRSLNVGAGSR